MWFPATSTSPQNISDHPHESVQALAGEQTDSPVRISRKEQDRKETVLGFSH